MKKFYFKKWVENLILIVQLILFLILISDSCNFRVFVLSKIIALFIFYINHRLLEKYTKLF